MRLYVDIETYSTVDIKKEGGWKYTSNCELILARFKLGDQVYVWEHGSFPEWVMDHCAKGLPVVAHNAMFEFNVLKRYLPIHIEQMICTQAKAEAHGLPGSLNKATQALGAPESHLKSAKGSALIRLFCMPRKPTKAKPYDRATAKTDPEEWALFRDEYLYQDVEALEWLDNALPDLSAAERQAWVETQYLNSVGIPIDTNTVKQIARDIDLAVDRYSTDFIRRTLTFPTQIEKIQQWLLQQGVLVNDLTKTTVDGLIANDDTPEYVKTALSIRQNISHASFKKYPAMLKAVESDDRIRGCFQYHAAHTGRFGGRLIQPHNFVRGSIDAVEAVQRIKDGEYSVELVKSAVRGMVHHPDGFTIIDYNAIEARTVAWLAGELDALAVFKEGKDPYIWMAQKIYEKEYDEVTDEQRFVGKQAVLGLGYQMWIQKFQAQAAGYGVVISDEVARTAVLTYRGTHTCIVALWGLMEQGFKMALDRPGKTITVNKYIKFYRPVRSLFLYMILPSGRRIAYPFPEFDQEQGCTHMGLATGYKWCRVNTYGGRLTENAVQGIARDIMVDALHYMQHIPVVMHIHDEIVATGDHREEMKEIMSQAPSWAEGLPLETKGHYKERFCKV